MIRPILALTTGAIALSASAALALDADYWRGGWRTELGSDMPHIYEFVIRGSDVSGIYCADCNDMTTMGLIDGTWDEEAGIDFTVTFPNADGTVASISEQHAMLQNGQIQITGEAERTLIKDPRGPNVGGMPIHILPPGREPLSPTPNNTGVASERNAYWQPAPFADEVTPDDLVGMWVALFPSNPGMNKQLFYFMRLGDEVRGVVCGRCDNPWTIGILEDVVLDGGNIWFNINHQDFGNRPVPFDRQIGGHLTANEMVWQVQPEAIDPANPPEAPVLEVPQFFIGPISAEATGGGFTTEGVDIWGPGTGESLEPPEGVMPLTFDWPE
ncbi:hypothetical protein ACXN5S_17710 [Pseudoroseicyclus sp. H15]